MEEARSAVMPGANAKGVPRNDAPDIEQRLTPRGRRLHTSSPEEISQG
jgi:hypothetical protein